ncbi:MAG: bifunctional DNA-formamidopyrimidine glycosylase/DNA-(apurinic or apyrimidinic site) lyase [Micrococcales bacterium]
MPELPEVETVRAGLEPVLTNATVSGVRILDQRSLKRHLAGPQDFVRTLTRSRILDVVRRGKFLWMPLQLESGKPEQDRLALVGHLGMSGQMLLRTPDFSADKLTRIVIEVTDSSGRNIEFRFVDQRIFGSLAIDQLVETNDGHAGGFSGNDQSGSWWQNLVPATAAHIARDPLDPNFPEAEVLRKLCSKNTGIKRAILDQNLMSGVGNIYADESLWRAKLHYDQPANSISLVKAKELLQHIREILARAVEVGGTSFDEQYKNVNGESGYFEISLNAYGRAGTACNRCGAEIIRENWANRGSHFCPRCQRKR